MTPQRIRVAMAIGMALLLAFSSSKADTHRTLAAATTTTSLAQTIAIGQAATLAVTGTPVPDLQSFDDAMTSLMAKWQFPGASLAVAKDNRLVFAHGYGLADVDGNQVMQPDSLFRIAGLSKTVTAAGILTLVEQGKLDLDAPAFARLEQFPAPPNTSVDPALSTITVRELLQRTGGWNADFEPLSRPVAIARAMGTQPPASCETTIGYMKGQPLDFDPGTRQVASNFGYCVLGRIIEQVSGQSYGPFIAGQILAPAGIHRMHLGRSLLDGHLDGEVHYYGYPGVPLAEPSYLAMGIGITPLANSADWWHQGALPGSQAEMVHTGTGVSWAVVFNSLPRDSAASLQEVDQALVGMANKIANWPANDLFALYP